MRPKRFVVTSGTKTIPMNQYGGDINVSANPAGSGNYDVAFTMTNIYDTTLTPVWTDVTDMSAATTAQAKEINGAITALRITLNSGTSVTVDIAQQA